MYGIVSLLDPQHDALVEGIWSEFKSRFGVHGVHRTPVAHFSYHVAEGYDQAKLRDVLLPIAAQFAPFTVRTNGLGIFTNEEPALYIPVHMTGTLRHLHQALWEPLSSIATGVHPLYHPERWVPHITLAEGDVDHELMIHLIALLIQRDFYWQIRVDNLTLLGSDEGQEVNQVQTKVMLGR